MSSSLLDLEERLKEVIRRKTFRKIDFYEAYPKQSDFHAMGATKWERCLMAANRSGKTYSAGMETAYHLTGEYPDWWTGKRFDKPTRGWAAGITAESTRDTVQRILLGSPAEGIGTGAIPLESLVLERMSLARGVSGCYDTILVRHKSGGMSQLSFKSYERGREKWQGETLDFIWFDEEPPQDIYSEGLTRVLTTRGIVYMTFTPLLGRSDVVLAYIEKPTEHRGFVNMTLEDAKHLSKEDIDKAMASWPEYEREARSKGIPMLGSGRVFTVAESEFTVTPFPIPQHWPLIWGTDFGVDHPFAAVLLAWDRDADIVFVINCIRMKGATSLQHAHAMRMVKDGGKIPVAWPHDGHVRREFEGDLTALSSVYKKHGLNMLPTHATFADGGNSTEVGILHMRERLETRRLKVFNTLPDWFEEYRFYHREDGLLVKERDDLMSATRIAVMDLRKAKPVAWESWKNSQASAVAKDVDIDPWGN
jgi:phage terminase large subunit-like protein